MNDRILLALHYFPSVQFCSKFFTYSDIVLEQNEHYRKGSYRNRMHIGSANGLLRLTIPLMKGKNQQQAIREVRISYDEPWQRSHWRAICSAYGNAPFFEHFRDDFEILFEERTEFLFDFNLKVLSAVLTVLDIQPPIRLSTSFLPEPPKGWDDFRNRISPRTTTCVDADFYPVPYAQVFQERSGFLPNLSILDLIFCKGSEAVCILEESCSILKKDT